MSVVYKLLCIGLAWCGLLQSSTRHSQLQVSHEYTQLVEQEYIQLLCDPQFDLSWIQEQAFYTEKLSFLKEDINLYWRKHGLESQHGMPGFLGNLDESVAELFLTQPSGALLQNYAGKVIHNKKFKEEFLKTMNVARICRSVPFEKRYLQPEIEKTPIVSLLQERVSLCLPSLQVKNFMSSVVASCYHELRRIHKSELYAPKDQIDEFMHEKHQQYLEKRK